MTLPQTGPALQDTMCLSRCSCTNLDHHLSSKKLGKTKHTLIAFGKVARDAHLRSEQRAAAGELPGEGVLQQVCDLGSDFPQNF